MTSIVSHYEILSHYYDWVHIYEDMFRQKVKWILVLCPSCEFDCWTIFCLFPPNSQSANCTNVSCKIASNGRTDSELCLSSASDWTHQTSFCYFQKQHKFTSNRVFPLTLHATASHAEKRNCHMRNYLKITRKTSWLSIWQF